MYPIPEKSIPIRHETETPHQRDLRLHSLFVNSQSQERASTTRSSYGSKHDNLVLLQQCKAPVPPFFGISDEQTFALLKKLAPSIFDDFNQLAARYSGMVSF